MSSRTKQFSAHPQQPFKAELDELPSVKEITKTIEQLKRGKAAGVNGILSELWKDGGPALHSKLHELLVCCCHLVQKPGRKIWLLQLSGNHSALHRRKNPCLHSPKQIGTHHRWRPSIRNSLWVQTQQGHHWHGVCPQTVPREMQVAEQRIVCSVSGPDQSI